MPPKYKYLSGCEKRKRKKIEEEKRKSQEGALRKFFKKEPQSSNVDEANVGEDDHDVNVDIDNVDANVDEDVNANVEEDVNANANVQEDVNANANMEENDVDANANVVKDVNANGNVEEDDVDTNANPNIDIFDPRNWGRLNPNMINELVRLGPKRDLMIDKGPMGKYGRRFTSNLYTRTLPNKETCDRDWLVYSKEIDKIFCFCCKLFRHGCSRGGLDGDGYDDWRHVGDRLKDHEVTSEHMKHVGQWYEMRDRLKCNKTIDNVAYEQYMKEKDYWYQVIFRIIAIVKCLAKHGLAFCGSNEKLYQKSNGIFLGLVEMLEEFDPIMKEHVRRVMNDETRIHYLGHKIQNEIILMLANQVKSEIIKKIKQAKYYSIILDCTPDTSHNEQMSIIVRYVNNNSNSFTVEESFLGFLIVDDTTGKGLFDVTVEELKSLGLDIDDMRGQGYDNGSNMKGKHSGVQRRFLDVNPRAFYSACGCHSLNLALCDMANSCTKASDFFGVIQQIYNLFANSTKRWQILKDNVKGLTLKSLSTTRWESRVDSVTPIRLQLEDVREALLEVGDTDNDPQIRSHAKTLAVKEVGEFNFLVSIVIWYDILTKVNVVSKRMQSKDMLLNASIEEVDILIKHFKNYREDGFSKAIAEAKVIANKMGVDTVFPQRRRVRRKKQHDETSSEEVLFSPEEDFKVNYFLRIVDQAIASLETRFEQYQEFEKVFGFMFPKKLRELDEINLKECCYRLQDALKYKEELDIDGTELYLELKLFETFLPREIISPLDALNSLKRFGFFPNALIAYRVLLTIPVTVASAERSFSKLKLLKTYLRSSMSQERLNGLAILSIENDILKAMDYKDLIESFATQNARRAS